MKTLFCLIAAACGLCASAAAAPESAFRQANALYGKGNFKEAEEAYRKLLTEGPVTEARLYNLGNAALRNGEKGKALVMYERALALDPRDEDARWNVMVVKSALTDRLSGPAGPVETAARKAASVVSANEAAAAFTACLAIWALFGLAAFLWPGGGALGVLRALAAVAVLASAGLFLAVWLAVKEPRAVVLAAEATARYGPSPRETKAFVLHEGAEARVADETDEWVYLALPDGRAGWVPRSACEIV